MELKKFKLNIQLFASEGEGGEGAGTGDIDVNANTGADTGSGAGEGHPDNTQGNPDDTKDTGNDIFTMGKKNPNDPTQKNNTNNAEGEGEQGDPQEINYSIDKIEGLTEDQINGINDSDEFKSIVDRARELGLSQEQFNFVAGTLVSNTMEMLREHRAEILELNPPKTLIYEKLSEETKTSISNGQLENFLIKASGSEDILDRVNQHFNRPEQLDILAQLAKGFSGSQAGIDSAGNKFDKGYLTKNDYFRDLTLHQNLIKKSQEASKSGNPQEFTRLKAEAEQLMSEIKEKKKYGNSSIFA